MRPNCRPHAFHHLLPPTSLALIHRHAKCTRPSLRPAVRSAKCTRATLPVGGSSEIAQCASPGPGRVALIRDPRLRSRDAIGVWFGCLGAQSSQQPDSCGGVAGAGSAGAGNFDPRVRLSTRCFTAQEARGSLSFCRLSHETKAALGPIAHSSGRTRAPP